MYYNYKQNIRFITLGIILILLITVTDKITSPINDYKAHWPPLRKNMYVINKMK